MGERKKLTMYYPPDFDPKLVPRIKRVENFKCEVRMMLPFTVQCNTCGEFMYMGKKFNSMKENAQGEKYKGIQIIRFYIKCSTCSKEMTFKTDPENGDYTMESGGSRTFEMWKEKSAVAETNLSERLEADKQDAMTALENRTLDSKKEMEILDALDELKAINQRKERVDTDALLNTAASVREKKRLELDEDEEAQVAKFAAERRKTESRLLEDEDEDEGEDGVPDASGADASADAAAKRAARKARKKAKKAKKEGGAG
eukprot:CAMPEP_0119490014 /NCGR_PEP_ID=MMETSP1344-20130328/15305_1 /TAXON_ID=236787 /ORGANISM="Florenciella parvula, Strain CCMP2471" /LENGTH=257 /DNA_ID=CAMNT_0007525117 /DNA_START=41 /DNA_END=810 /DNA_ORIENTATION=+